MGQTQYLSTDPNAGTPVSDGYLSTDPTAGERRPDFRVETIGDTTNEGLLDRLLSILGTTAKDLNPVTMIKHVVESGRVPELGGAFVPGQAAMNITKGLAKSQWEELKQAIAMFREGRISEGVGHGVAGVVPVLGPMAAGIGADLGEGRTDEGLGHLLALAAPYGASKVKGAVRVPPLARNPNPAEAAAVEFGVRQGIPVDAGTATGNYAVRGAQALADRSIGGSLVATGAKQRQGEALTRVGQDIANRVYPEAVTAEQAGEGITSSVTKLIEDLHAQSSTAYDKLRQVEADPKFAERLPTAPAGSAANKSIMGRLGASMPDGRAPSPKELQEVHRILAEMDAMPFNKHTFNEAGRGRGGDLEIVPGSAGAPVYDDILQAAPGTSAMTRGEIIKSIRRALATGEMTNAAQGAFAVARARIAGGGGMSSPTLPPSAGEVAHLVGKLENVHLPVDLRAAKKSLKVVYDRMMRQLPITQARSSPGLKAIENIVNSPDFAPVSQVDMDLGQIKGIGRGADLPQLRDLSQGLAAKAIEELEQAVQIAVAKAGPEATGFRNEGRAATVAKYQTAGVLKELRAEPVQVFGQATWARDAGIDRLHRIAEAAPAELSKLGRAYLDELLTTATAEGGFSRAQGIFAKWQNLGPKTKDLLFGHDIVKDLDHFFLLAKKAAENPNPSGSGFVASIGAQGTLMVVHPIAGTAVQIGGAALSTLLRSPRAVRALTRGFTVPVGRGTAATGAADAILNEARRIGVPMAAEDQASTPTTTERR